MDNNYNRLKDPLFYVIMVAPVIVLLMIGLGAIYILPMSFIDDHATGKFCKENGFDYSNQGGYCITNESISSREVACRWGFYKATCKWKEVLKVVEVSNNG